VERTFLLTWSDRGGIVILNKVSVLFQSKTFFRTRLLPSIITLARSTTLSPYFLLYIVFEAGDKQVYSISDL